MCVCPEGTLVSTIFSFWKHVCVLQNHEKSSSGKQKNLGKMIEKSSFVCFFFPVCLKHAEMN